MCFFQGVHIFPVGEGGGVSFHLPTIFVPLLFTDFYMHECIENDANAFHLSSVGFACSRMTRCLV